MNARQYPIGTQYGEAALIMTETPAPGWKLVYRTWPDPVPTLTGLRCREHALAAPIDGSGAEAMREAVAYLAYLGITLTEET